MLWVNLGTIANIVLWLDIGTLKNTSFKLNFFQVYLNGKKAGSSLSHTHRKAVIPCKPKRTYKVNLVALSGDPQYDDSPFSNTLVITTAGDGYGEPSVGETLKI